jgi:hypothetical protein
MHGPSEMIRFQRCITTLLVCLYFEIFRSIEGVDLRCVWQGSGCGCAGRADSVGELDPF